MRRRPTPCTLHPACSRPEKKFQLLQRRNRNFTYRLAVSHAWAWPLAIHTNTATGRDRGHGAATPWTAPTRGRATADSVQRHLPAAPVPRHPLTGVRADCEHPNATHEPRQCPSHTSHESPPSTVQRCLHEHPRAHSSGHVRLPPSTKSRTSKVSPEPHPASRKQALRQACCSSRLE